MQIAFKPAVWFGGKSRLSVSTALHRLERLTVEPVYRTRKLSLSSCKLKRRRKILPATKAQISIRTNDMVEPLCVQYRMRKLSLSNCKLKRSRKFLPATKAQINIGTNDMVEPLFMYSIEHVNYPSAVANWREVGKSSRQPRHISMLERTTLSFCIVPRA